MEKWRSLMDNVNVVLVLKKSKEYSLKDVLRLAKHLHMHKEEQILKVYCITDIIKKPLTIGKVLLLPMEHKWEGWWSKMNLFSPELSRLRPFLYLDLDVAVVAPYMECIPCEKDINTFITLEDFYQKEKLASGMMWIPDTTQINNIWKNWMVNPAQHIAKNRGDQDFLRCEVGLHTHFFQHYCDNSQSFKPLRKWLHEVPKGKSIIHFHGVPKIEKAAEKINWVSEYLNK